MMKPPKSCSDVKCMQHGCKNTASHKIGEINIYDKDSESTEFALFNQSNQRHEFTTYLCDDHFNSIMKREEFYGDVSKYGKNESI